MKQNPILERSIAPDHVLLAEAAQSGGVFPFFATAETVSAPRTVFGGREMVNLGSNNYLGLANDERVIEAVVSAVRRLGTGLTGSRLMNGNTGDHEELEDLLCRFTGAEAALVFSTGYVANLGLLTGLCSRADTVVIDSEVHASLIDGIAMAGARVRQFRHNNVRHAMSVVDDVVGRDGGGGTVLVVDGIYSMRGDIAPLVDLADLCDEKGVLLVSDEAHGLGVVGDTGVGAAEMAGVLDRTDAITYTFSKSLASCGGAIVAQKDVIASLKLSARPFLFTASNTPGATAAATASLQLLMDNQHWPGLVMDRSQYLRSKLLGHGIPVNESDSAIITIPIGGALNTLGAWRACRDAGVFVNPVLSPAVAPGKELLRLSVMRTHSDEDLDAAAAAIASIEPFLAPAGQPDTTRRDRWIRQPQQ